MSKHRLLLVNPSEREILECAGDRPPLGLAYTAANTIKHSYPTRIIDLNHQSVGDMFRLVADFEPTHIGIGFTTPLAYQGMNLASRLSEETDAILIAGGAHPSALPKSLEQYFDVVIKGEGEQATLEVLSQDIRGIHRSRLIPDIDVLPLPARYLLDMDNYGVEQNGQRTATLITSRGCYGKCGYCSKQVFGGSVRMLSPERVEREVRQLVEQYGYNSLYFLDDTFTASKDRVVDIADRISKFDLTYRITTRADSIDEMTLQVLRNSGLSMISLGIEHADNEVLEHSNKGMTIEQNRKIIRAAREMGIYVKGFFILNLPGATKETALRTVEFGQTECDSADYYPLTLYPGTKFWQNPNRFGITKLSESFDFTQAGKEQKTTGDFNAVTDSMTLDELLEVMETIKDD